MFLRLPSVLYVDKRILDLRSVGGAIKDTVAGDGILVMDERGKKIWQWSVFDVVDPLKDSSILKDKKDWMHANSLSFDEDGNYLMSFYNNGQIWKISAKSGAVMWKFGKNGTFTMPPDCNFSMAHNDGFNNSANLYMEHFPYLNRLWFGEYFDYEKNSPDFFLTEVSGFPFGLMGEMLQDGGNAWRGMVYGMTNRMPWSDNADPRAIWKVWDDFGMQGTKIIGYWSDNCPVKTSNANVLSTVYKKEGKALLSIASWANKDTTVQLQN